MTPLLATKTHWTAPQVFNIPVTTRFVIVTVTAHAIFGTGLGLAVRYLAQHIDLSNLRSHAPVTP